MRSKDPDDEPRRNSHARVYNTRRRTLTTRGEIDQQQYRDEELRRGARESYNDGIHRKFPIREDEGGWNDE